MTCLLAGLTLRARLVVRRAHQLAQQRRTAPIPNRLVLAGFLADEQAFASRLFNRRRLPAQRLCEVLVGSAEGDAPTDFPLDAAASARIIAPMIDRARVLAGTGAFITERTLFRAFCEIAEPRMKSELKPAGIDLDLLGTCDPDDPPPPAAQSEPRPPKPPQQPPDLHPFGLN